jgi:hypothetical protein
VILMLSGTQRAKSEMTPLTWIGICRPLIRAAHPDREWRLFTLSSIRRQSLTWNRLNNRSRV